MVAMRTSTDESRDARLFGIAFQGFLVLAFLTGGSAQISGVDDTAVQLLALPVLGWALWRIGRRPASRIRNAGLAAAGLVALVPLLQLLPLTESLWQLPEARRVLAADMAVVGAAPPLRWSLAPAATEQAFLFLLAPLAAFAGTLAVRDDQHRRLLRTVMALALSSLLLAFVQLGVPAESLLNPFPQWAHQFNGIFANQNHQGISLVVAIVIALAAMPAAVQRAGEGRRQAWTPWVLGFLALFALCALPLTGSRGAVLIAVFAVAVLPLALGLITRRTLRGSALAKAALVSCIALVVLGAWGAAGWMQVDAVDELRGPLRAATFDLGLSHAPLGTGLGAFVAAFEQGAPAAFVLPNYVNHAHNDWLQWWMEAGWLGVSTMAVVVAVLVAAASVALRQRGRDRAPAVAASFGIAALLLHSWVDYPLRTVSLATAAAVLAAILVARAVSGDHRVARLPHA